jgi:hypothetical protein
MKRAAVLLFILGILSLAGSLVMRVIISAQSPAMVNTPPGEGRLEPSNDNFSGLYRSWSLGGRESTTEAQTEAVFRLGIGHNSQLINLELHRRALETKLTQARINVEKNRAIKPAALPTATDPGSIENAPGTLNNQGDAVDSDPQKDEPNQPKPSPGLENGAITGAQENLGKLEEEYQAVLADLDPKTLAAEKERLAEIAVLGGGASRGVEYLLASWGQPFRSITAENGLAGLIKHQPVLIIPSGALEAGIRGQLNTFVHSGGTIICFTQRKGAVFSNLPGHPRGYGWLEAESSYSGAVEVASAHPGTVACQNSCFSAAVDGFFCDQLPKGTQVLLRSTSSGCPVAIVYPFGKGRVIATTLYTDWEAMSGSPGENENVFYRDLTLWAVARNGGRLNPALNPPGAKLTTTLLVENLSREKAQQLRVAFLTPEGQMLGKPFNLGVRILPNETINQALRLTVPNKPGVWHIVYALVGADGSLLQYWRNGLDLISGIPAVAQSPAAVGTAITCQGEVLPAGLNPRFTLHLWNYHATALKLECGGPNQKTATTVPGGGNRKLIFTVPADRRYSTKGYYEFSITGPEGITWLSKFITTVPAGGKEASR